MVQGFGKDAAGVERRGSELLGELALQHPTDVERARELSSLRLRTAIEVRPADICDRGHVVTRGTTSELQRHGTVCVCEEPVPVGSMFHLGFDPSDVVVPPQLAVCDRCAMLSDTAFEVHFQFAQEIDVPRPSTGIGEDD